MARRTHLFRPTRLRRLARHLEHDTLDLIGSLSLPARSRRGGRDLARRMRTQGKTARVQISAEPEARRTGWGRANLGAQAAA